MPSKLDLYKPLIDTRLKEYPKLTAVRLFKEVRAAGYPGSYNQVKRYVRKVRPRPPEEPVVRFETAPGRQGQVDFAHFRLPWGKRYALIVVLGYSRLLWVQFYTRQTMKALMHGLESSFSLPSPYSNSLRAPCLTYVGREGPAWSRRVLRRSVRAGLPARGHAAILWLGTACHTYRRTAEACSRAHRSYDEKPPQAFLTCPHAGTHYRCRANLVFPHFAVQ